ncbi:MAG: type II secretion system protein GspD [Planctomycetota bacterium]|jgi:type II secretory pathway component GspD/PulD (secretin)
MKRATILLLVMGLMSACDQMQMTRFEYGDIRLDVGGRLEGVPGEPVALGPMPTGFARFGPGGPQVLIEVKLIEVTDQFLLDLQFWPGHGDPLAASSWTDLTPQAPEMTVGFGVGGGGGGDRYNDGYNDRANSGGGFGTGVGVGIPIGGDDGRGVTHVRSTFELEVTPTLLGDDGFVLMLVALERQMDGRILAQPMILPTAVGPGAEADGTTTPPQVETRVLVVDGETFVIGGLIQDRDEIVEKIPLLGDLPLLNRVFRGDDTQIIKKDLIVFLSPHIVIDPGE